MIFKNPDALWLLLAVPPLLAWLGLWGWRAKKEALAFFSLNLCGVRRKQVEKYILAGLLMALTIMAVALPNLVSYASAEQEKAGEIALLVDVSGSMAARTSPDSISGLERVKPMLYKIVDEMEKLGQVNIALYGFTDMARSLVPYVGIEDYPYLKESIDKVLDIYSVPGEGTSIGKSVQDVIAKFSDDSNTKLIVIFSDGEPFTHDMTGMTYHEKGFIEQSIEDALEKSIKIITVGVGDQEGTKIPLYNSNGEFTGEYYRVQGIDYIAYLEDSTLKQLSEQTEGQYFSENNLDGLIAFIKNNLSLADAADGNKEVRVYTPVSSWFLLAGLSCWAVFIKRHLLG